MKYKTLEAMNFIISREWINLNSYLKSESKLQKLGLLAYMDKMEFDKVYNEKN